MRKLLVEAAWHHKRAYARPGIRLQRQLDLVDSEYQVPGVERQPPAC